MRDWKKPARLVLPAVVLAAAGCAGAWQYLRPRIIKLWVVSDYGFRERRNWQAVLDARFRAVNAMYRGTGVEWRVLNSERLDGAMSIESLDLRRAELEKQVDPPADVVVSVTGRPEGDRLASVNPFSHALVVVDFPRQSEEQNARNLAHELARLFGAPVQPAGSGGLMALPPVQSAFNPRTAALIHRLRNYDFAGGIASLDGRWQAKAVNALAQAYALPLPEPLAHAHVTLALALQNGKRTGEAAPHAREAVKLDPQSTDARQALAHVLIDDLQVDAAEREMREAVRLFPEDAGSHATLGAILGNEVATEEAVGELRKAEELAPQNSTYPVVLGRLLVEQAGRMEEGRAEFEKAARLDPQQTAARVWLARMEETRAQAAGDLAADRRRVRAHPGDAEACYRLGLDEARLGDHQKARAAFQKAVNSNPRHGRALSDLAVMDYYCGDYEAAMRHADAARQAGAAPPAGLLSALRRQRKAALPRGDLPGPGSSK